MVLWLLRTILFAFATASAGVCASLAQDTNYASVAATPDVPVRLSYHASAHKSNCSPGALPTVHVIEAPKSGMLIVRQAVLTTNKIEGCPDLKIPAQVVFYTPNTDYTGPDHVKYTVTDENSQVATYDMTINVEAAQPAQNPAQNPPAQNPPAGTTGPQPQ
jgi:hypothetical protein